MLVRFAAMTFLLAAIGGGLALWLGVIAVPDRFNPWARLELQASPNVLTRYKLAHLSKDPATCHEVLATSAFRYERVEDHMTGEACGFFNAVEIEATAIEVGEPFSLSCRAAVSLALWEHHVLQPAALAHFGQSLTRIEHYGSYSCRNVYGRPQATRSRHATAEALDIAGFVLADGSRVRVLADWHREDRRGQFLREAHAGACRFFDAVLGPSHNEAHADHFHLDRGPARVCR